MRLLQRKMMRWSDVELILLRVREIRLFSRKQGSSLREASQRRRRRRRRRRRKI